MKWSALAERVHQSIKRKALLQEGDKILVAVSGGMDSVVLLHVLLELQDCWKWELVVGHIDHGLRPGEDKKESELCKELARHAGLEYYENKIDLNDRKMVDEYAESSTQNPSLESLARNARYAALNKWADELNCNAICVGHHLNDQAETVLYRMLTGSGLKGLRGVQSERKKIKRPLIEISKDEIVSYAQNNTLKYYDDPSNLNERFVRNQIRQKVIPSLKAAGFKDVEGMLASSARSIEEANEAMEYYVNIALNNVIIEKKNTLELRYVRFMAYPVFVQKQVLRKIFEDQLKIINHISEKQLMQLITFIADGEIGSGTELLNCRIIKDRQTLNFIIEGNRVDLGALKIEEIETRLLKDLVPPHKNTAYFSCDLLGKDLFLKSWEPGDRLTLFGSGQSKKISDILKDERIGVMEKAHYPVLMTKNEIIWIPGVKRSNLYKVTPGDDRIIKITYTKMENDNDQKDLNA